jgi:hypothetical protein
MAAQARAVQNTATDGGLQWFLIETPANRLRRDGLNMTPDR